MPSNPRGAVIAYLRATSAVNEIVDTRVDLELADEKPLRGHAGGPGPLSWWRVAAAAQARGRVSYAGWDNTRMDVSFASATRTARRPASFTGGLTLPCPT